MKWVKFWISGHFPEYAWRKWPQILHADVSWPPSELISLWPRLSEMGQILDFRACLLIFLILVQFLISETGQIWGFRAFPGERMEEMASNFAH